MPTDQNHQSRRPHFHRGRRGDRRGAPERRSAPTSQEPGPREQGGRDGVDVEQIMRDIRARIAQRHGIELSTPQIQELAARRLEAILDPRTVNPSLLEQLRKGAGALPDTAAAPATPNFTFEDTTLFETHRGFLRFMRRLLHPILKLFFNPTPLIHALNTQARLNTEALAREAERERRQAEWNALHYELLQRMVTEVSRVSFEMQALAGRIESLSAKVDFNERRVRGLENTGAQSRPAPRREREQEAIAAMPAASIEPAAIAETPAAAGEAPAEGQRRKRRRRRGRRSGGAGEGAAAMAETAGTAIDLEAGENGDVDEGDTETDDLLVPGATAQEPPTSPVAITESFVTAPDPEPYRWTPPWTVTPWREEVTRAWEPPQGEPSQPALPRDEPTADADRPDPGPPDR